ncbi:MAG: NAD/NADP octopine/nopaline dehydrogenase family protein [Synergistaceae bacterium]|nr:NAD/NADP octopine/nopaline dehydrogenase family protein [Synergistaceae bacterium]
MVPKKIAVLGGGNGGHTMAADFTVKGHTVNFYEMPKFKDKMKKVFETQTIEMTGLFEKPGPVKLNMVTDDIEKAIEGCRYIILVTPAFAHGDYAQLLKGKVKKDQIIVVFPGAFAALQLRKVFGEKDCPVIADVNNLPYDTRLKGEGRVEFYGRNDVNIGFMPASAGPALIDEMREDLFPFVKVYNDVLESGLSIVNPAWHTGPCLLSVTSIEHHLFNFFVYEHGWTPSACKLNIVLDQERKAVGKELGYSLTPMEDFSGMPVGFNWKQLYAAGHGAISLTPICGPNSIWDRYLTEDCPFGLVPWAEIAKILGVAMPTTNSCIDIYNIIHEKDWRKAGLTAEELGIAGMNKEQLIKYVREGIRD